MANAQEKQRYEIHKQKDSEYDQLSLYCINKCK